LDKTEKISAILNFIGRRTLYQGALYCEEVEIVFRGLAGYHKHKCPVITKLAANIPLLIVNLSGLKDLENSNL